MDSFMKFTEPFVWVKVENFDADMQLKLKYFKRNFHIFRYFNQPNAKKPRKISQKTANLFFMFTFDLFFGKLP